MSGIPARCTERAEERGVVMLLFADSGVIFALENILENSRSALLLHFLTTSAMFSTLEHASGRSLSTFSKCLLSGNVNKNNDFSTKREMTKSLLVTVFNI